MDISAEFISRLLDKEKEDLELVRPSKEVIDGISKLVDNLKKYNNSGFNGFISHSHADNFGGTNVTAEQMLENIKKAKDELDKKPIFGDLRDFGYSIKKQNDSKEDVDRMLEVRRELDAAIAMGWSKNGKPVEKFFGSSGSDETKPINVSIPNLKPDIRKESILEAFLVDDKIKDLFEKELSIQAHKSLGDRNYFDWFYKKFGNDIDVIKTAIDWNLSANGRLFWEVVNQKYISNFPPSVPASNNHQHSTYTGGGSYRHSIDIVSGGGVHEVPVTISYNGSCCDNPDKYKNIISNNLKFWSCRNCGADLGDIEDEC